MKSLALAVALFGLVLTEDNPAKNDLDRYQGTWVLVSEEYELREIPFDDLKDLEITVKGNQLFFNQTARTAQQP